MLLFLLLLSLLLLLFGLFSQGWKEEWKFNLAFHALNYLLFSETVLRRACGEAEGLGQAPHHHNPSTFTAHLSTSKLAVREQRM